MLLAAALAALLQGPPPPPADTATAYLDPAARELVTRARERRSRVERSIDRYQVTARARTHVGIEALSRTRTMFGQETAVRIDWRREGGGDVRVLGARSATPAATSGVHLPDGLRGEALDLVFDPDALQLDLFSFDFNASGRRSRADDGSDGATPIDPLLPGSEAHYRFRSGDTATVRLPDGSRLRLVRLDVFPRRSEFRLVRGSLWIDTETYGVARSVLTTARPFDLRRDADADLPRMVSAMGPFQAVVRYVTVEYALHRGRYWLPRLVAVDAEASIGILAEVPVRFERSYSEYEVEASTTPPPPESVEVLAVRADSQTVRLCREEARGAGGLCRCEAGRCRVWQVEVPTDTAALLASDALPPPLSGGGGERLITGETVESLSRILTPTLGTLRYFEPSTELELASARLLRYNRVEGLSVAARGGIAWGPLAGDVEARLGLADLEPKGEVGISRESGRRRFRGAGYRRLATFDPGAPAPTLGASLNALVLGRDESDYLLATGVEASTAPIRSGRWSWSARAFAEHQHPTVRNTQLTLARAWDDTPFRPVRAAERADQVGAALTLARDFGGDRAPARLILGSWTEGQTGAFRYGRGRATARLTAPRIGRFALALEGAAGTTAGEVPIQGLWYLGGPTTVRGYEGALLSGESFWRARAEVGTRLPAARVVAFSDAGWAGGRDAWSADPPLLSVGAGGSVLDGLIRLDVSRALRGPTGWRVDLYLDGAM